MRPQLCKMHNRDASPIVQKRMGKPMNRTKRKIFETAMELFAKKGYDGTSVEEITSVVGIAKGTLYYHFTSKEEIFNFLIEEGMNLLKNSIEIKTAKYSSNIDKLKAVILIQIKTIVKYENLITLVISQMWGKEERNIRCRQYMFEYIKILESIIKEGIEKGEIIEGNPEALASGIFGFTCSGLIYKLKNENELDIQTIYKEFSNYAINGLKK